MKTDRTNTVPSRAQNTVPWDEVCPLSLCIVRFSLSEPDTATEFMSNQVIPWSGFLLENLVIVQFVKKFPPPPVDH
jgi:hypothetical protein